MAKAPCTDSAAVTARVVSRLLRKHGFKMADTSDRTHWTEGFHVHRVGYSSDINVDYHVPGHNVGDRVRKRTERQKGYDFLTSRGYVFFQPGYIKCEGD